MFSISTRADVARRAKVSVATVSYVLNNTKGVSISPATCRRVLRAARDLKYTRHRMAANLARGRTRNIGVVIGELTNSFWAAILEGIEGECIRSDYRVALALGSTIEAISEKVRLLWEQRVEGLIVLADCLKNNFLREASASIPVVFFDDLRKVERIDYILSSDISGAVAAVTHLIRQGHRRIAYIAGVPHPTPARERKEGYLTALRQAGIAVDSTLIRGHTWEAAHVPPLVHKLLECPNPPTAFFAASDYLAAGVLQAALERGLRVPGDLAVAGYGNTETGRMMNITTVDQSAGEMGRLAVQCVMERWQNPKLKAREIRVPTQLVIRRSTDRLNQGRT